MKVLNIFEMNVPVKIKFQDVEYNIPHDGQPHYLPDGCVDQNGIRGLLLILKENPPKAVEVRVEIIPKQQRIENIIKNVSEFAATQNSAIDPLTSNWNKEVAIPKVPEISQSNTQSVKELVEDVKDIPFTKEYIKSINEEERSEFLSTKILSPLATKPSTKFKKKGCLSGVSIDPKRREKLLAEQKVIKDKRLPKQAKHTKKILEIKDQNISNSINKIMTCDPLELISSKRDLESLE